MNNGNQIAIMIANCYSHCQIQLYLDVYVAVVMHKSALLRNDRCILAASVVCE